MVDEKVFENCLALGRENAEELLSSIDKAGPLVTEGPMSREEAVEFFLRYHLDTFPLYMLEEKGEYFAFH